MLFWRFESARAFLSNVSTLEEADAVSSLLDSTTLAPGPILPGLKADVEHQEAAKKRVFKKFSFKGVDLDALLDMSTEKLVKLFPAGARRRFQRGMKRKPVALIKKLREAKREAPASEKPELVKTHLCNMIIVPEMIGSLVGMRLQVLQEFG